MMKLIGTAVVMLVVVGVACWLSGCRRRGTRIKVSADLLAELEAVGFFAHSRPDDIAKLRREIQVSGFLFPDGIGRAFPADAEDLAEQGSLDFVARIAPFLKTQGISIPLREEKRGVRRVRDPRTGQVEEQQRTVLVVDDTIPDVPGTHFVRPAKEECPASRDYYRVTMGKHTQEILNRTIPRSHDWEAAMCHTLLLINNLLSDAGSPERAYGLYGGNDGHAVFLTERQFEIIRNAGEIEASEKPWKAYVVKPEGR